MNHFLALVLMVGLPAGSNPESSLGAVFEPPRLADQAHLVANCGVWQGRSQTLNAAGEITATTPVTKTIAIVAFQALSLRANPGRSLPRPRPGLG